MVNTQSINELIFVEARSSHSVNGQVATDNGQEQARTRWLLLRTLSYRFEHDPPGFNRHWDVAERTTRDPNMNADAVAVFAKLKAKDDDDDDDAVRVILVKQFRPAVKAVTLELPAGLIDKGENAHTAALRELREETGFVGVVVNIHPPASLSSGLSNECVILVEVDISGRVHNGQQLDPGENIHVISVPLERLQEAVHYIATTERVVVSQSLAALAVGVSVGARHFGNNAP